MTQKRGVVGARVIRIRWFRLSRAEGPCGEHGDRTCGHDRSCDPSEPFEPWRVDMLGHDLLTAGQEHDQDDQRRGQHSIQHRRPEQRFHRIEAGEINRQGDGHGDSDHDIEAR